MANIIIQNVRRQHASANTVYHALYGHFFLGMSKKRLAEIYGKAPSTITEWFTKFDQTGAVSRKKRAQVYKKFGVEMRTWLVEHYNRYPILFLDEAQSMFQRKFKISISVSSVWAVLHEAGMTWKTIERRAIQIREDEIVRYVLELLSIPWDLFKLVFLDEVSFDNRDMLRTKGYGVVEQKVIFRGEFCRKPRASMLCFLGSGGILDSFWTEGTFTRLKFFDCCRDFALKNKKVQRYPGFHSVWIMDGAKIHCDRNIIMYLRSIGILPIFLPAYCPFFNPLEIIFGLIKKDLQRHHRQNEPVLHEVLDAINRFKTYSCLKLFEHCGYFAGGSFLPEKGLGQEPKKFGLDIVP
ncbi:LOW QUALITY PROTEIN: uncharacterized protein LOC119765553 [Culex quinquefasciatus]|uniref:LOW QUALITY PROTEIN: uncharacterized protein LOC119765553 n=1 Tax=Culex quinquefasciatus TaxID=7176 RepID=UPI0018E3D258|nr:LOW QUALITY PROTEIN: uncharacterized protein LOC119765553 [Culex quinquefasciatus]